MKIIVDAFGGDNAPLEILKGCAEAVKELDIDILLTGSEAEIRRVAKENDISLDRMEIADTPDVLTMEDHAGAVLKEKSNSSTALGLKLLAEGKGDGFLSGGNSGALVVGTTMIVKRIKNIKRVAFAPILPKKKGFFMLIDSGANVDCKPEMLRQFVPPKVDLRLLAGDGRRGLRRCFRRLLSLSGVNRLHCRDFKLTLFANQFFLIYLYFQSTFFSRPYYTFTPIRMSFVSSGVSIGVKWRM